MEVSISVSWKSFFVVRIEVKIHCNNFLASLSFKDFQECTKGKRMNMRMIYWVAVVQPE